ncbi:MAG: hypothetical protein AAF650_06725 [Pseudomonadota bacterium]
MKAISELLLAAATLPLAAAFAFSACASEPAPVDAPNEIDPVYTNYLDEPQTPGTWEYVDEPGESLGLYGVGNPIHPFVIRCDKRARRIGVARRTDKPGPLALIIQTESTTRQFIANTVEGYGMVAADLDPADSLLDAMAITKGRFVVGLEGEEALFIPAWAEVTRVIEDCR